MTAQVRHVDKWVTEGIISRDQAQSICEYERRVTPSRGTIVEVLGYIGASMVAASALVLVSDVWDGLSLASRLALLVVSAISLVTIGVISARDESDAVQRFGRVFLMLAVPVIGVTAQIASSPVLDTTSSILLGSALAFTSGLIFYRQWRSTQQHIALFFATVSFVLFLSMYPFERVPDAVPGSTIFLTGVVWVILASAKQVTPRTAGEILGSATAFVGSMVLAVSIEPVAVVTTALFVAVAGGAVAFGVTRGRVTLTGVGMLGIFVYLPWFTNVVLSPAIGAPLALLITGGAMAYGALRAAKAKDRDT